MEMTLGNAAFRTRRRSPEISNGRDLLVALLVEPSTVLLALVFTALVLVALSGAETSSTRQPAPVDASLEAASTTDHPAPPQRRPRRFARK